MSPAIDWQAVNRDPQLRHTPIGRVFLRPRADSIGVYVDDGKSRPRLIHVLDEQGVHQAFHGKAWFLRAAVRALYAAQNAEAEHAANVVREDLRKDRRRDFMRFLTRDPSAREVVARMLGGGARCP